MRWRTPRPRPRIVLPRQAASPQTALVVAAVHSLAVELQRVSDAGASADELAQLVGLLGEMVEQLRSDVTLAQWQARL